MDSKTGPQTEGKTVPQSEIATAIVANADGVRPVAPNVVLRELVAVGRLIWIDIVGNDVSARARFLAELGLEDAEIAWVQRFDQKARMAIGPQKLRVVTWIVEGFGGLIEIHLLCHGNILLTVWNGDASALHDIRVHFAERASELEKSPYQAAAIILQLLLGTLHHGISELDDRIQSLGTQLNQNPGSIAFSALTARLKNLQTVWSNIDRYSSAVQTAIIGVEALPGVDQRSAAELNDYADQVQDLEHRLHERTLWASDVVQNYATAIAQRQGEQINRLTLVSMIFLPITFLTGFFGMNFHWMNEYLVSPTAFLALGILLPVLCVTTTVLWLKRRGLI
jgi:Mg2+ and Co2+ transporter CorA